MQYRGVVHRVGGDNTHTSAVQGGGPLCGGRQHTLMQYRGVVHRVGGDNTHTSAV